VKRNEQIILVGLVVVGVIAGFWLLMLSPKRDEASKFAEQADQLQSSLQEAQQSVAAGEEARGSFGIDYRRLVVLGKAVPADDDQASLLVQLQDQASRSGVQFQSIDLSSGGDSASTAAPTTAPPPADSSSTDSSSPTASTDTSSAIPATEAAASTLPIGASVGPAGLPVMSYDLTFTGEFFQIADFMRRVDSMVHTRGSAVDVQGRLLTVNGFSLEPSSDPGALSNPVLTANVAVTTYLTPADQGLTGGATPSGPPSATPTLASSSSSTSTTSSTSTSTTP
jgi:Tfp pilus assembly protein PilO